MDLRRDALEIYAAAVEAVKPAPLLHDAVTVDGAAVRLGKFKLPLAGLSSIYLLAAGKAAVGMARAALDALDSLVRAGIVTAPELPGSPLPEPLQVYTAGHPVPDEASARAATAALSLAQQAGPDDLVLCLLSGGASALWSLPAPGLDVDELRAVTSQLLASGADIREMNTVRKHLSAIAGGRLAQAASPARIVTLAISDVIGSPPEVIGSGPTVPDPTTVSDAAHVVEKYGLRLPEAVYTRLYVRHAEPDVETPKPGADCFRRAHFEVLADNAAALRAASDAARGLGYSPFVLTSRMQGEAREVGRFLGGVAGGMSAEALPAGPPAAVLLGGETTVTVRGAGIGGRCQEMALAAAEAVAGETGVVMLCAGTDGRDGPTDAAGAVIDGGTIARGEARGFSAAASLSANAAYEFLDASHDLIRTGPTGTNVADLVVLLAR